MNGLPSTQSLTAHSHSAHLSPVRANCGFVTRSLPSAVCRLPLAGCPTACSSFVRWWPQQPPVRLRLSTFDFRIVVADMRTSTARRRGQGEEEEVEVEAGDGEGRKWQADGSAIRNKSRQLQLP